jgi:hypothetical protein
MAAKKKVAEKKRGPRCLCINEMNKAIAKQIHPNLELQTGFNWSTGSRWVVIPITKKEKDIPIPAKSNVKHITANYCPFCGKKYQQ